MAEAFGDFELLERLKVTAVSETFRARRREGNQSFVVFERVHERVAALPGFRDAFFSDLEQARTLQHPGVIALLQVGEVDGQPFVVRDWFKGQTLQSVLDERPATPLSPGLCFALMRPVLDALAAAHACVPPLIHRDISALQVWVDVDGQVKLDGFGVARSRVSGGDRSVLSLSPEQARGHRPDARSDVFAAGVLLYRLACGRLPSAGGMPSLLAAIAAGELDAPTVANPALPASLDAVLRRALSTGPENRFADAAAFLQALDLEAPSLEGSPAVAAWLASVDAISPDAAAPPVPARLTEIAPPMPSLGEPPPKSLRLPTAVAMGAVILLSVGTRVMMQFNAHRAAALADEDRIATVIDSLPHGAQVFVDGKLEASRSPTTVRLDRHVAYTIELRYTGLRAWHRVVRDQRELMVNLNDQQLMRDERYGEPPPPKQTSTPVTGPAAQPVAALPAATPATPPRHHSFGAPAAFDLIADHQVVVPTTACGPKGRAPQKGTYLVDRAPLEPLTFTLPSLAISSATEKTMLTETWSPGDQVCQFSLFALPQGMAPGFASPTTLEVTRAAYLVDQLDPENTYVVNRTSTSLSGKTATAVMLAPGASESSLTAIPLTAQRLEISGVDRLWFLVPVTGANDTVINVTLHVVRRPMPSRQVKQQQQLEQQQRNYRPSDLVPGRTNRQLK